MDLPAWWAKLLFLLFGGGVVICSVGVLLTRDIVRAAVWLLFALGSTAGLYFLLGADFIGAVQLLVYVGGTLVLVVFGVMLTARRPFLKMEARSGEWVIGSLVAALLLPMLAVILMTAGWPRSRSALPTADTYNLAAHSPTARQMGLYLLGLVPPRAAGLDQANRFVWDRPRAPQSQAPPPDPDAQPSPQQPQTTAGPTGASASTASSPPSKSSRDFVIGYLLPFEMVSVHFLVVLIGAAYLARARRRRSTP